MQELLKDIDVLKRELSSLRPLPPGTVRKINEALEIEYTYESNRIEGNTLTLMETNLVVNEGVTISGKPMREHLEAINHAQAIDFIKDISTQKEEISERLIKDIHAIILHGIDRENVGKYRTVQVMIAGSNHTPPEPFRLNEEMQRFIQTYISMEHEDVHPVVIASYLHAELVRIHPFIDGNGRTARLLMNLYFLSKGYTIVNIKGDREQKLPYYQALEEYSMGIGLERFSFLVATSEKSSLERYLHLIS